VSDTTERWSEVLDDLYDRALTATTSLERGDLLEVAPWSPPDGLGPVPATLEARAREVLELLQQVQVEGAARAQALRDEVGEVGTRRDAVTAYTRA
jgi:hypothetical protein